MSTEMSPAQEFLVVDDDPVFNSVLCRALARRGYSVGCAHTPAEALTQAQQNHPTRIVLDLNLGGDSGLALVAPLRAACPGSNIVVLTGYASIATAVAAIKLGASQYLAKPIDVDTLLAAFHEDVSSGEKASVADLPAREPLTVERLEWEHLQRILLEHGGNVSATARALKMHRRTLQRKLLKRPTRA